jgi:hypothetical protein
MTPEARPGSEGTMARRWENYSVWLVAAVVAATATVWAFFAAAPIGIDDIGLFNPVYMYVHTGRMAYPSYGFLPECTFEAMVVHPPTHYLVVALLIKAGIPPPYAESIPPFVLIIVTILIIGWSRFSSEIKVALLFGFLGTNVFLRWIGGPVGFSLTPEQHLAFAWMAGLVTLEAGRVGSWDPWRLGLGAFLLTYASGIHYPASFAWTGCLAYGVWAAWSLGWRKARGAVGSLMLGGLLFGIPYLLLFVLPHWKEILCFLKSAQAVGSVRGSLATHIALSKSLYAALPKGQLMTLAFLPLALGVPTILVSTPALAARRQTRGIALAALPSTLFILLFVERKWSVYLLPELMVYLCGVSVVLGTIIVVLVGKLVPARRHMATLAVALVLCTAWLTGSIGRGLRHVTFNRRLDERALARAAGRQMLGPNALVGTRISRFYTNGGDLSYMIEPDVLWSRIGDRDLRRYFAKFDAITEDPFTSYATWNERRESLTSWYSDGTLRIRGFYFSQFNPGLSYLLLHPDPDRPVEGYAHGLFGDYGKVARFRERRDGDYVFVAAVGPAGFWPDLPTLCRVSYLLPLEEEGKQQTEMATLVMRTEDYLKTRPTQPLYEIRDEIRLGMEEMTTRQSLATLRNDQVIRFYRRLSEAVEARAIARKALKRATRPVPLQ